jgi:ketosteroid isomerase-like protein
MRHGIAVVSFLAATVLFGSVVRPQAPQPDPAAEVRRAEEAFRKSQLNYDTAAAKEILADEFIGTWNHAERVDKQQFLTLIADRADPLEALDYADMQVRVYGDTAVVWSTIHERAVYGGKIDEYQGRRTAVWVKRQTRWRCVTIHTSALEKN